MPEVVLDEVLLGESVLDDVVLGDSASSEVLPSAEVPPGELPSPDASAEGESESSPVSAVSGAAVLGAAASGSVLLGVAGSGCVAASVAAVLDVAVSDAATPCADEDAGTGEASDTPSGADPESPPQAAANSETKTRTASQQRILDKNAKTPPHAQPPAEKPAAGLRPRTSDCFFISISISTILRKGVMGMRHPSIYERQPSPLSFSDILRQAGNMVLLTMSLLRHLKIPFWSSSRFLWSA